MNSFIKHSLILVVLLLFSCEEYLDKSPDKRTLSEEDIYTDYENLNNYLDLAYTKLYNSFSGMYSGSGANYLVSSSLCGETFPAMLNGSAFQSYLSGDYQAIMDLDAAPVYSGGDWNPAADFVLKWPLAWQGITICNNIINNIDQLQDTEPELQQEIEGQALFLRAYFYFEIMIRWGGFEYLTENIQQDEVRALVRTDLETMVQNIADDCDAAKAVLPHRWRDAEFGRPPRAAALALKSRLYLYAASPLFNTTNNTELWQRAADAAWEAINYVENEEPGSGFELIDCSEAINIDVKHNGADLYKFEPANLRGYRSIHLYNGHNPEVIFNAYRDNVLRWVNGSRMIGQHVAYMVGRATDWYGWPNTGKGHGATVNMVNMFETKSGLAIKDDNTYNPQNPHINRDPRFYANILFDNVACKGQSRSVFRSANTMSYEAGITEYDKNPTVRVEQPSTVDLQDVMNVTGYCVRKYWPLDWYNKQPDVYIQNIFFRMAELYLNYAEAAFNGYGGSAGQTPGAGYTALSAVNKVRNRVGMPNVEENYSEERILERIHNERAVELCFENHRYWDIRRWKEAHLQNNREVKVMMINYIGAPTAEYPTGFRFEVEDLKISDAKYELTFEEKHYWWPLRKSETELFEEFGQTEGW